MERPEGGEAERVYGAYGALLTTVVGRILDRAGTREDVEECVQDVLWEYLRDRDKWDAARGSEKTYLCVLARSRARSRRRQLLSAAAEPLEEIVLTAPDGTEAAEVRDALGRALAQLTPGERRLFTLRFLYEWTSADIGKALGLAPSAVTTRVGRLRGKLKKLLALQGVGMDGKE